ncbi:MAG: RNase adapter RapZ [Nevskia sp.]|nr:RNase adapter RapZ [Nevskia sp.]
MRLVIVSGLSGTGKTVALKQYEDLGYYCIDNIPLDLLPPLIAHAIAHPEPRYAQFAIGVDARGSRAEIKRFPEVLNALRAQGVDARVLFLTADDAVILRRYHETRRRHPLAGAELTLDEAIGLERKLLAPIAALADFALDTSAMNLHELRQAIHRHEPAAGAAGAALLLLSFGYKNGLPDGADFVFDVRCLPNPHWVPELRELDGRSAAVKQYLERQAETEKLIADIGDFLERWLPAFLAADRSYLTVGIGCTGGQHRSVYVAEVLAQRLRAPFGTVMVKHRELVT